MIYAKLLEFQKKNITISKDATNPHFRSKYSSLNEVLEKVKAPLNELGVVIVQIPEADGVRTRLYDTGLDHDENKAVVMEGYKGHHDFIECFVPYVGATDMQKLGGAITYARRYSLVTLLGLEDEDDDGETATVMARKGTYAEAAAGGASLLRRAAAHPSERNDAPNLDDTP